MLGAPELELDIVGGLYNSTPLIIAVITLPAERVGLILHHGASIDFIDDDGDTALMTAADIGDAECLKLLLEKGADFLKISKRNQTALRGAMKSGNVECAKLLLARTDFILRELQGAAEQGKEPSQTLIASEKKGWHDAMAKQAAEAKAKAAKESETETDSSCSGDSSLDDGLKDADLDDDVENGPVTANWRLSDTKERDGRVGMMM